MLSDSLCFFFHDQGDDDIKKFAGKYEIWQGDILLTKDQMAAINNGLNPNNAGGARKVASWDSAKWPRNRVYYTIKTSKLINSHALLMTFEKSRP